ncbi:MAG: hypothetical protein JW934_06960 [Anaerolineae bacterium]|nr:hypothetical protein [Anaerolineae bacterium]
MSNTQKKSLNTKTLQEALDGAVPDRRWLKILEVFAPTGVADQKQILAATDLSGRQFGTVLEHYRTLARDNIIAAVSFDVPKPGARGRPPALFKLGESGAALLRRNGYRQTRPCNLSDAVTLGHARTILDIYLAAQSEGLEVQAEENLNYTSPQGDEKVIRPDALITLPDGGRIIIEIEQEADITLLKRIVGSLRNRVMFFKSEAGKSVSRTVRVLFNVAKGQVFGDTLAVWERAAAIVAGENRGRLPFDPLCCLASDFLNAPDWSETLDAEYWEPILDPAQTKQFAPTAPKTRSKKTESKALARRESLPEQIKRRTPAEDRLILQAYWHHVLEHGPEAPDADPAFFEIMKVIYLASNDPEAPAFEIACHPYASLYLLRKYLEMHPMLRAAISKALARGGSSLRLTTSLVQHRMQVVIDLFLRYHGWQSSWSFRVAAAMIWHEEYHSNSFGVSVHIHPAVLTGNRMPIVPGREEIELAERALAWVLLALFKYSQDIGLKQPVFW